MSAQTVFQESQFFLSILNSIEQQIAVINSNGAIVFVNDAWVSFGLSNAYQSDWLNSNYLDVFAISDEADDENVHEIYLGLKNVIEGRVSQFSHEYPCHSQTEKRWFMMTVTKLHNLASDFYVITHVNITQRKLIEQRVEVLSLHDSLTGLPNRRYFEQFLPDEWHRNERAESPISLVIFDIDCFKKLNDEYGHVAGDLCLINVASVIQNSARRAGDLAVRWGGEEFILILGNTDLDATKMVAEQARSIVESLSHPDYGSCTVSAGVACIVPTDDNYHRLIELADSALYEAKNSGRNRVVLAK